MTVIKVEDYLDSLKSVVRFRGGGLPSKWRLTLGDLVEVDLVVISQTTGSIYGSPTSLLLPLSSATA